MSAEPGQITFAEWVTDNEEELLTEYSQVTGRKFTFVGDPDFLDWAEEKFKDYSDQINELTEEE